MCAETILYGFHRPIQLIPPCLKFISWKKEFMISKIVVFTDSCRYILDKGDQHDWNKLFGFFYGIFGIHKNSVRFVWRYDPIMDKIEIAAYYYSDGQRIYTIVKIVDINTPVVLTISRIKESIMMSCDGIIKDGMKIQSNKLAFGCGLYFGGNRRAPQNITIKMCDYD